jgi:exo-beta-1,3-glucanase (GH17 family)
MPATPNRLTALLLLILAVLSAASIAHWVEMGRPQPVPEPAADRLQCLSYAPFRKPGETPFDPTRRMSEARIEEDLRILLARSSCVRTYTVQHGLDAVPRVARRLGMTVLLGAWVGRDPRLNDLELATAVGVARNNPDVVRGLIVGNEVMLRREIPEADLVALIVRARSQVTVPVTYADVWEFWVKHPSIAPAVSFMTIHILPYWEDDPIGIDASIDHVLSIYRRMQAAFPGREMLIGETGWPSDGRARRDAVPGRVEQARFVRQFTQVAQRESLPYNLIEGFDQPWKRRQEGAMGGNWGLFDSDGREKFEWRGPVAERPDWQRGLWGAAGGAALLGLGFGALGASAARRRAHEAAGGGVAMQALVGVLAGAGTGAMLAEQWRYMVVWNRGSLEWTVTLVATVIATAFTVAAFALLARRLAAGAGNTGPGRGGASRLPSAMGVLHRWRRDEEEPGLAGWTGLLLGLVLFAAAYVMVLHTFDSRYRGFPLPLFAAPVAALALLRLSGLRLGRQAIEERWLAAIVGAGALWMLAAEGLSNPQAIAYAAAMLVLAVAAFPRRAITSSPRSVPAAAGS